MDITSLNGIELEYFSEFARLVDCFGAMMRKKSVGPKGRSGLFLLEDAEIFLA